MSETFNNVVLDYPGPGSLEALSLDVDISYSSYTADTYLCQPCCRVLPLKAAYCLKPV